MKIIRIVIKTTILLILCNAIYAIIQPNFATLSIYNHIIPGRERLPYGENPQLSYNISSNNLPTLFESHIISRPKATDEFRVLLIGDSSTWGWFLTADETLAAQINTNDYHTPDGRRIVAYNLGYPIMSLTKDLLILDYAMRYEPDLVIWLITLESLSPSNQTSPPIIQYNPTHMIDLIERYNLNLPLPKQPNIMDHTIIIQRRELANWLRLQTYGFAWAATRIDQYIPDLIPPQPLNFNETTDWEGFTVDSPFEAADLSLDLFNRLELGIPLLIVNEPMFISDDPQHYNIFYPRWAYDHYRQLLSAQGWTNYIDLSDSIPPQFFTDSPVHLNAQGIIMLRDILMSELLQRLD